MNGDTINSGALAVHSVRDNGKRHASRFLAMQPMQASAPTPRSRCPTPQCIQPGFLQGYGGSPGLHRIPEVAAFLHVSRMHGASQVWRMRRVMPRAGVASASALCHPTNSTYVPNIFPGSASLKGAKTPRFPHLHRQLCPAVPFMPLYKTTLQCTLVTLSTLGEFP
jgi:hypothetical protein